MPKLARVTFVLLIALFLGSGCSSQKEAASPRSDDSTATGSAEQAKKPEGIDKPSRIILLIGDGMGVPAITGASYAHGSPLAMLGMDQMGWMTTHSHEFVTTDSAASATAIATGHKTHYEGVSVKPGTTKANETDDAQHLKTVLEKAEEVGWRTGLVSTSKVVHATPAAFAAHRTYRGSYEDIAYDMANSGVDVLLGGGPAYFTERSDDKDLLEGFEKKGYKVALSRDEILQARNLTQKLVGLPHNPDFPPAGDPSRAMTLAEMTESAIEVLDRNNDDGFFLMVEGSQIDWRGHDLDGEGVIKETLDFDGAVQSALAYARGRKDTLVVVTSDHETGGMAILDPHYGGRFKKALGGDSKVAEMTDWPDGVSAEEAVAPAAQVELGFDGTTKPLGPAYAKDKSLTTVFGHLSLASRAQCKNPRKFSGLHTPSFVPVFSDGKAAEYIAQAEDNAQLGRRLKELVGPEFIAASTPARPGTGHQAAQKPQNIIVMVGDGMGISSLTAAHYGHGSLAMRGLPVKGIASTHAADRLVTDSAAGATAIATGRRSNAGAVGMARTEKGLVAAQSLIERAESKGMATGIITSTTLTHATPAAFYGHHANRGDESKLAGFFVDMPQRVAGSDGIDLAFGAGAQIFGDKRIEALEKQGVVVQNKWEDALPKSKRVVRFLGENGLAKASERMRDDDASTPTLRQMTNTAIDRLSKSEDGFVLVVEGGQIDWAQHGMVRDKSLIDEVVDFDEAVAAAYDFAKRDGNTLLVVTADHDHTTSVIDDHYQFDDGCSCAGAVECGGSFELKKLAVAAEKIDHNVGLADPTLQGKYAPLEISIQYAWLAQEGGARAGLPGPHSANFVPIFAYGPLSERFGGYHDLTDVGAGLQGAL